MKNNFTQTRLKNVKGYEAYIVISIGYLIVIDISYVYKSIGITLLLYCLLRNKFSISLKTFYVDIPVNNLDCFKDNFLIFSGGGGGMKYGIADQTTLIELTDQKSCNKYAYYSLYKYDSFQSWNELDPTLKNYKLKLVEILSIHSIWGLKIHENFVVGGFENKLIIIEIDENMKVVKSLAVQLYKLNQTQKAIVTVKKIIVYKEYFFVLMENSTIYCIKHDRENLIIHDKLELDNAKDIEIIESSNKLLVLNSTGHIFTYDSNLIIEDGEWKVIKTLIDFTHIKTLFRQIIVINQQNHIMIIVIGKFKEIYFISYSYDNLKVLTKFKKKKIDNNPIFACVDKNQKQLAIISDSIYMVFKLENQNLVLSHKISKKEKSALPPTCACFTTRGSDLIVGSADYKIEVCTLKLRMITLYNLRFYKHIIIFILSMLIFCTKIQIL